MQDKFSYSLVAYMFLSTIIMLMIVIADSRGRNLDAWIENEQILVSFKPGAKLFDVALSALEIIPRFKPDMILLMAGINDITIMNKHTRRVRLISNSSSAIISHVTYEINKAKSLILNSYPDVKIAVGGIIGICLNVYNRCPGISRLQPIIDEAITGINAYIHQMNSDSGLPHPRLTSKVHVWKRGVRKCIYSRLTDGLHPSDIILNAWARQLNIYHDLCRSKFAIVNKI